MKKAKVLVRNVLAGILTEDDMGYEFHYDPDYLKSDNAESVSLTLPLTEKPYRDKVLFPFFDGLLPKWTVIINESFLPVEKREEHQALISRMATRVRLTENTSC